MNINEIWSNILAYKPIYELCYNKKQQIAYIDNDNETNFSKCVQNYLDNSPYKILQSLDNSINAINITMDNLKCKIQDVNLDFIDKIDDSKYVQQILQDNLNINGNCIFEIYYMLYQECNSLNDFKKNYIINNFGINVNENEIQNITNDINDKIMQNETKNNLKNNYINIAFDSYCNAIIGNYLNDIENDNNKILIQALFKQKQNIVTDNSDIVNNLIQTEFDNNIGITKNNYDKCTNYISSNTINKAYNQCCNLRKEMSNAITVTNAKEFSQSTKTAINCLNSIKNNTIKTAFSSIDELTKSILLSKILKNNYTKSLIITENYKNIYNI